jgi:pimeloyl-ACP methyl ester carboxylesterase
LLLRDEFSVVSLIADIDVPTTVVFGSADTIIPPDQSRAVARAAAGQVEVVEIAGAEHNDEVMFTGSELIAAVEALADRSVGPAAP